jgi:putative DNA primase/helicase
MTDYSIPKTVTALTGSYEVDGKRIRGMHMYFVDEPDRSFPADLSKIGCPGIDIKSNGYAIGPGSIHPSGVKYEWKPGHAPWETEIARMPENVLDDIAPHGRERARRVTKSPFCDEEWETKWGLLMSSDVKNTPYAEAAIRNACSEIKKMKPGDRRNNALNAKAFSLGHLIGGGQLNFVETRERLIEAARHSYKSEWRYKEENVENVLREWGGAFELGAREPKYPVTLSAETLEYVNQKLVPSAPGASEEIVETIQTGLFDARGSLLQQKLQKVIQMLGPIKVGPGKSLWRYVDGVWRNDGSDEVVRRTEALLGESSRKSHTDNILHFMSAGLPEIKALGPLEYLNCQNVMLRLSDLAPLPHSPDYLSTVQLATTWNSQAECPTVDLFLTEMAYEDTIDLIWEVVGVCIYLGLGPQHGVFFRGGGRNGKGTLLRLIRALIPDEFDTTINSS